MIAPISVRVVLYRHGRLIRLDSNSTVTSSHEWAFDSDRSHWICFFRCLTETPPHAAEPPSRKPTGCADCTRWVPTLPRGRAGSVAHAAGGTTIVCCTLSAHDSPRSRGCFVVSALGAALLPIPVFTSTRNIKPEGLTKILGAFGNAVLVRLARGDATCPSP